MNLSEKTISETIEILKQKQKDFEETNLNIALFGQPGAGKSSLINALIGEKKSAVGLETDKTVEENIYMHNGLNFIDLPGYGTEKFPKETYFDKFKILDKDLFLCVISGKLLSSDIELFEKLHKNNKVCIFVVNKADELWEDGVSEEELKDRKKSDVKKYTNENVEIVFTSCRTNDGILELNLAIRNAISSASEEKKTRWILSTKAYSEKALNDKKEKLEELVTKYAGISAVNGINPIPGVNVAIDIATLLKLFKEIRESYGLTDNEISNLEKYAPSLSPLVNQALSKIVQYSTKQGIIKLLSTFAGKIITQNISKYIPFVGQAIASGIGFGITKLAGDQYVDDCHEVAKDLLIKTIKY